MEVQRLQSHEAPRFKEIRLCSLKSDPESFASTYSEVSKRPDSFWAEQLRSIPVFIFSQDNKDLGLVRVAKDSEVQDIAWIISLWVNPQARSKGVGMKLMKAALEHCRKEPFRMVKLEVGEHNIPAIRLYEKCGFHPNGVKGTLPEPQAHIVEMQMEHML